ncbi:IclR family transcriptional regulator C-terminal domain-containing protein [Streptomyces sparsogenes]|uniref:IclR family transcriptional regulator domain-containing protein n=1 Tax=Streptomyces sparsogenes TaxID=67365 RepID=UPI0033278FF7
MHRAAGRPAGPVPGTEQRNSVSDQDVALGVAALGVPIPDYRGQVRAALSISGVREAILGAETAGLRERLVEAGQEVSRALGWKAVAGAVADFGNDGRREGYVPGTAIRAAGQAVQLSRSSGRAVSDRTDAVLPVRATGTFTVKALVHRAVPAHRQVPPYPQQLRQQFALLRPRELPAAARRHAGRP